ncbi:hypothetical protein BRADI_2g31015v3 [Brachypodium distachyon]|uniref:non-specific serine/threonine protein kinase n=1 Tax=Brachypodium distachyon TaxID=15368 RepID=A0A0Q3G8R1_BRADI|nr:hypothetical protein BRADI_2g31015v3 [Brachypodium distachyon]
MPRPDDGSAPAADDTYSKALQGRYELGRVIGRGPSSKVYRARLVHTGVHVAVKAIRKPRPQYPSSCSPEAAKAARRSVEREVAALWLAQGHPHVVRLLDLLASRSTVYLVLDLARGGSLQSAISNRGGLRDDDERAARRLFAPLASALAHLHSRGICSENGGQLTLADTLCGSPAYVAPEILRKRRYDAGKADVWSSGVTLFSLVAGYLPFNDGNLMAMYRKICSGRYRCPKWFSPELRCLLGRMLDPEPDTRINIRDILEHPWLRQQDGTTTSSLGMVRCVPVDLDPEVLKWEAETEQVRELNAFDIVAFASGCDLSGLIGPLPDRVRFVVAGVDVASVLDKAEELGREEGFTATQGKFVARIRVNQLLGQILMVEAERTSTSDIPIFWGRLQLGLRN